MRVETVLTNDERTISGLYGPNDEWQITTGGRQANKIVAYLEDGDTPWFAVYRNDKIIQRVNAAFVESVVYAD